MNTNQSYSTNMNGIKRTCTKCGKSKLLKENFNKTSRKTANKIYVYYRSDCKTCRNKERKTYHINNREKENAYARMYYRVNAKQGKNN